MTGKRGGVSQVTQSGSCPDQVGAVPTPAPSRTRFDSPHGKSAQAGGTTPTRERHCSSPPANSAKPEPTEKEFQAQVIALAQLCGWRVAHFRPAQNARGDWRTPVAGDGAGFPDLVLVRDRVLFVELKTNTGKLAPAQVTWSTTLQAAGAEHHIWRPRDWNEIETKLSRRAQGRA